MCFPRKVRLYTLKGDVVSMFSKLKPTKRYETVSVRPKIGTENSLGDLHSYTQFISDNAKDLTSKRVSRGKELIGLGRVANRFLDGSILGLTAYAA